MRRLGKVALVGCSPGAPFALACAATGPAEAVAAVAGTDEQAHSSMRGLLVPDVVHLVARVENSPDEAEQFFAGLDAATLWKMISAVSSETDRALYAHPSFAAALRRAIDEGQGSAGYAPDALLTFSPWPFDPGAIRARVTFGTAATTPAGCTRRISARRWRGGSPERATTSSRTAVARCRGRTRAIFC